MKLPHLSTRCPHCGDTASMPHASKPVLVVNDAELGYSRQGDLYAVMHVCPNLECPGTTVAYYSLMGRNRDEFRYESHRPCFTQYVAPETIPARPRTILQDANDSKNFPVACAGAAVKAVEAMMAEIGFNKRHGGLKGRITDAVAAHILPQIMADWAEEVRQIGNEVHTDENPAPLPTKDDAEHVLLFANTLATYLFVLPDKIGKARPKSASKGNGKSTSKEKGKSKFAAVE